MSKKDYIAIARIIKERVTSLQVTYSHERIDELHIMAINLAQHMQMDNDKFDYSKFMTACGFE